MMMESRMLTGMYGCPLRDIENISAAVILLWTAWMLLWKDKAKIRRWNGIGAMAAIGGILYVTVLNRVPGSCDQVFLMPLSSLTPARYSESVFREMVLNVCLFLPLGILLPFAMPDSVEQKGKTAVIAGAMLSVLVEGLQYIFDMGCCETDDVLMNTLGMLLGGCSYVFFRFVRELFTAVRPSRKHARLEENAS
ncbi:MAG: VanZ family protein [Clostridia bacterium]|nr:VanZ family protein [Clostridia bacterium]